MNQLENKENPLGKEYYSCFYDKSIWIWWIGYIILAAVLFGLFYLAYTILTVKWWISLFIIIGIGFFWGTYAYMNRNSSASR